MIAVSGASSAVSLLCLAFAIKRCWQPSAGGGRKQAGPQRIFGCSTIFAANAAKLGQCAFAVLSTLLITVVFTLNANNSSTEECRTFAKLNTFLWIMSQFMMYIFLFLKQRFTRPLSKISIIENFTFINSLGVPVFALFGSIYGVEGFFAEDQGCIPTIQMLST